MEQSLYKIRDIKKLAVRISQNSEVLVLRGEAPGRNFRGTGTQRGGGGSEDLSTTKIQVAQGWGGAPGAEYRRLCSNRFPDRTLPHPRADAGGVRGWLWDVKTVKNDRHFGRLIYL